MAAPAKPEKSTHDECPNLAFSKIVALGYYDGPTEGVAECAACQAVFKFEMIDEDPDWEQGEDVRVFRLSALPAGALSEILAVCPDSTNARWPIWGAIWHFESHAAKQTAEATVERVLGKAGPPEYVVASSDGLRTLSACKPVTAADGSETEDWFRYLGLARRERSHGA